MYMDAIRVRVKVRVMSRIVFKDKFLSPFEFTFLAHGGMLISIRIVVRFSSCNQLYMFAHGSINCESLSVRVSRSEVLERRCCGTLSSPFSLMRGC